MSNVPFDTDLPLGTVLKNRASRDNYWELRLCEGRKRFWSLKGIVWDSSTGYHGRADFESYWDVIIPKETNVLKLLKKVDEV